ncbi:MAG: methyltransferase domain-containing protein [Pyrinomonadaceae bacterium]
MSKTAKLYFIFFIAATISSGCLNERILRDSGSEQNTNVDSNQRDNNLTDGTDAPYLPTHQSIVDEMLAIANVTGDDVLYDLGSGDGRIPITAALRYGTRGVGIDIDPVLVSEAHENARNAKIGDKVRFIVGDIFEQDFSDATVVMLYLSPELNLKLRPQLQKMKPGTRIVSHNHDMADWKPEKAKSVKTPSGVDHTIYFWRVP